MKKLICALMIMSAPLCAGIAPKAAFNNKKEAMTQDIKFTTQNGEFMHIATYPGGSRIITYLSGYQTGYQYIEEDGKKVDESIDYRWHHHSFTHYYPGGKVRSFTIPHKGQKCQKITYRTKAQQ